MMLLVLLSACSDYQIIRDEDPGLSPEEWVDSGLPAVEEIPEDDPPLEPEEEVVVDCSNGERIVRTEVVRFPARQDCMWSADGNLAPREGHNQARFTETRLLDLPAYADLCSLSIISQTSDLEFDDYFTLTLEDWILVGGGGGYEIDALEEHNGMYRFDWEALKGQPWAQNRYAPYYCLGEEDSLCVVPPTEQPGAFDLAFSERVMRPLAETLNGESGLAFSVHTFGDNDGGDCAHSDIELVVEVELVQR